VSCGCQSTSDDFCPDVPESTDPIADVTIKDALPRRTLLKAAAVGTTVAAIAGRDFFTPAPALADDLSTFQCTANDVRIVGAGQIINEPCNCTGTFNAEVAFTVENNAASERGCITLHLVPAGGLGQIDVILQGTIAGKTTQTMTGFINNYPCGAGFVCFGSASGDGRRRCEAGECSTVSWTVPGQDTCPPDKQISSKCRHQQICIQGRGSAGIDCVACQVDCGGNGTVRISAIGGVGPFTYGLSDGQSFGPTSDTSHDFTVGPITTSTNVTGSVTDGSGCVKSTVQATLTPNAITPSISAAGDTDCDGVLTFTGSAAGFTGCSFAWTIDTVAASNTETDGLVVRVNADGTLGYRNLDGTCHTIGVTATCGSCIGTASTTVTQCVTTTVDC
jgi:hypothetical protein